MSKCIYKGKILSEIFKFAYVVQLGSLTVQELFDRRWLLLRSADKVGRPFCFCSVFSFFLLFFFIFLYRSPASLDFSVISQPISLKFCMLIVLDKTNRLNIFSGQKDQGSG